MKSIQSPFDMELFFGKKDWLLFIGFAFCVLCVSLFIEYSHYRQLLETKNINAKVLLQYKKDSKYILKLRSERGEIFYTTSRDDLKDLRGRFIGIYGKVAKNCDFSQYLKSCFFVSYSISLLSKKSYFQGEYIKSQHLSSNNLKDSQKPLESRLFDEFGENIFAQMYLSLFLAQPMPKDLRNIASALGISHIFAISGFHLGILSFVLFGLLKMPYGFFQKRYFPYRNEFYDINNVILIMACIYLYILSFTPSFLRSFVMFALGLFVLHRGLNLLSFKLLFACVILILALFPRIFFSIGFWLSVSGIFYIYLYLKYFKLQNKLLYAFVLNIIVFLNLLPISHYIFYDFSLYAVLSPLITMLFIVFYPLALLLHLFGFGGIFDNILSLCLLIDFSHFELQTSLYFLFIFGFISLLAIFYKTAYYAVIGFSILYFCYGILKGVL